ncbi:class I SAM-dependent methyltransferase [Clostridium oceanicum]|uniref:Uncharacterized protein n=1 Tax=Clostridium oceanicum TaxID=1543 RepID=A0ABN1JA08_9CLOT
MKEERALYYNSVYTAGGANKSYHKHYSKSQYIEIWNKALELIKGIKNCSILDVGCGPGQFANLLFDNNINNYMGLDFSTVAIDLAKKINPRYKEKFLCDDIYTSNVYKKGYNVIIMLEVLEHLQEDMKVLKNIEKESNVIFSVPNFICKGHVRCFKNKFEIVNRYKDIIDIKQIFEYKLSSTGKIYLVDSIKI